MFDFIKGKVERVVSKNIVLENNNIGFIIHTANPYSYKEGEEVCVYTYTYIREEIFDLYGFKSIEERDLFIKLISVKGIGPKGALAIIASGQIEELKDAIRRGDSRYLQKFPGIGPKSSGQIVLDLRGKLDEDYVSDPKKETVLDALRSLGYKNSELKSLDKFINENIDLPIEKLIKLSLQKML